MGGIRTGANDPDRNPEHGREWFDNLTPGPLDYVASLGYRVTDGGAVQCVECFAIHRREGSVMRGHRRRCPVAPREVPTPGVCDS